MTTRRGPGLSVRDRARFVAENADGLAVDEDLDLRAGEPGPPGEPDHDVGLAGRFAFQGRSSVESVPNRFGPPYVKQAHRSISIRFIEARVQPVGNGPRKWHCCFWRSEPRY